ncbi:uncharacterized protein LOC116422726 [Sarcophilus harrisii]|uniref:uncharacterized protein LOC116422726 n=1 Tax=Sarcophilus harrisii TaxID=9305 RepID=UPI001301DA2F|nr:uncharacterized protein LOC116422726 [Sarcophilus harrisii]
MPWAGTEASSSIKGRGSEGTCLFGSQPLSLVEAAFVPASWPQKKLLLVRPPSLAPARVLGDGPRIRHFPRGSPTGRSGRVSGWQAVKPAGQKFKKAGPAPKRDLACPSAAALPPRPLTAPLGPPAAMPVAEAAPRRATVQRRPFCCPSRPGGGGAGERAPCTPALPTPRRADPGPSPGPASLSEPTAPQPGSPASAPAAARRLPGTLQAVPSATIPCGSRSMGSRTK